MDVLGFRDADAALVIVRTLDRASERHEKFNHHGDVSDVRDIGETVLSARQEARRHLLQNGVLGAVGSDLPR